MRYFGDPYPGAKQPAPVYLSSERCETPIGEQCYYCKKTFVEGDQGFELTHLGDPDSTSSLIHRQCLVDCIVPGEDGR